MTESKLPVAPLTEADIFRILSQQADAGNALVMAGLLEDELEKLLLAAGRSLETKDAGRIFGRLGHLSSFAAKIEIAYMFKLIDQAVRDDLRVMKSIRNAFAHTTRLVHFNSPHIAKECRKLSTWQEDIENQDCYRERARECVNVIRKTLERFMFANALMEEPSVDIDDGD
jgi:hypothetical protein